MHMPSRNTCLHTLAATIITNFQQASPPPAITTNPHLPSASSSSDKTNKVTKVYAGMGMYGRAHLTPVCSRGQGGSSSGKAEGGRRKKAMTSQPGSLSVQQLATSPVMATLTHTHHCTPSLTLVPAACSKAVGEEPLTGHHYQPTATCSSADPDLTSWHPTPTVTPVLPPPLLLFLSLS